MRDLNNLRHSAQDMLAWSVENDDKFLNIESRGKHALQNVLFLRSSPPDTLFWGYYYSQTYQWNAYLARVRSEFHANWQSGVRTAFATDGIRTSTRAASGMWSRGDPQSRISALKASIHPHAGDETGTLGRSLNAISHDHTSCRVCQGGSHSDVRFPGGRACS